MPFELRHTFVASRVTPKLRKTGGFAFYEVELRGEFTVLTPGRLIFDTYAEFEHRRRETAPPTEETEGEGTTALQGGFVTSVIEIPLTLKLFTPDGREFAANGITLADLRGFRDARGAPSGRWSFLLTGRSNTFEVGNDSVLKDPKGRMSIVLIETLASESAPPLINNVSLTTAPRTFEFDLYRIGNFIAKISLSPLLGEWRGTLRLVDPDGVERVRSTTTVLTFKVGLLELGKSRDASGKLRNWKLEVAPQVSVFKGPVRLQATVIASGRITVAALQSRIDTLLGKRGEFLKIFGEDKNGQAMGRLQITNTVTAETLDMHGLLDGFEADASTDEAITDVIYTLGSTSEERKFGTKLRVGGMKATAIDLKIGPGIKLGASVPTLHLGITVSGKALVKFEGLTVAEVEVRGGKVAIEIGMKLSADGTPEFVTSVPDTLIDGDIKAEAAAVLAVSAALTASPAAIIAAGGIVLWINHEVDSIVKKDFNDPAVKIIRDAFSNPTLAPSILMRIFGAHLTYQPFHFEGEDICFDHIAPIEPEPKPRQRYLGAIGRSFIQGIDTVRFSPVLLPDTWKADNLAKIDHIVVVMMENRSYDHVLGYRATGDGSDGLTPPIVESIEGKGKLPGSTLFKVRNLKDAQFPANKLDFMTCLPASVGHEFHDVQQQLGGRISGPGARPLLDPKGFVDNFTVRLATPPADDVDSHDVLGFYDGSQLQFFEFLARNYAYCDRYYCSHPGPTLPNRMYSLTGDLQYDRYGFPIIDNNAGDNFLLSRAATIYDLLERKGKKFRVYESAPSVTMLRMFARYATDTVNIVPIGENLARLKADAAAGKLPEFTVIEPAMHHHPQNDDHPDADMYRGQVFLQQVYDALSTGPKWHKTLLIITYDEHGGFYDHVPPPVAELLPTSDGMAINPGGGTPSTSPGATAPSQGLLPVHYGPRVPTFVVSPWTMRGKGPNVTLDHCSILKTVLARFLGADKPFLSDRVSDSHSFNAFLTESAPRAVTPMPTLPDLPPGERIGTGNTSQIITPPLSRRRMRAGPVDFHDITGRWARQLGR